MRSAFVFVVFVCAFIGKSMCGSGGRVLLRDVQTLTLQQNLWTTARRGSAVPQLKCIGGCKSSVLPRTVQCYNRGSDGVDVQWECKAELDKSVKFGKIEVSCEGYEYPDDPYVLTGSCGLEYSLERTGHAGAGDDYSYFGGNRDSYGARALKFSDILFFAIVILFIVILYKTCITPRPGSGEGGDGGTGGYPGGGGGGPGFSTGNPRPPPYGWNPGGGTNYGDDTCYTTAGPNVRPPGAGGFGGFWTGLGAGGLLGYLMGNRNQAAPGYGYRGGGGTGFFGGGGGYGTNFGGGGTHDQGPSTSSTTHTSSGFGTTKRR